VGFVFEGQTLSRPFPGNNISPVEAGVNCERRSLEKRRAGGLSMVDVKLELVDGSPRRGIERNGVQKIAGRAMAVKEAAQPGRTRFARDDHGA